MINRSPRRLLGCAVLALVAACSPPSSTEKATDAPVAEAPVAAALLALTQQQAEALFADFAWRFGRGDGSVIAARIVLRPDGAIAHLGPGSKAAPSFEKKRREDACR